MPIATLLRRRGGAVAFRPAPIAPDLLDAIAAAARTLPAPPGPLCAARLLSDEVARRALIASLPGWVEPSARPLLGGASALFVVGCGDTGAPAGPRCHMAAAQMALAAEEADLEALVVALPEAIAPPPGPPAEPIWAIVAVGHAAGPARAPIAEPEIPPDGQAAVLLSLLEIAAATTAAEDLDRLLESIAQELSRLFPVDRADAAFVEDGVMRAAVIVPRDTSGQRAVVERVPVDESHHLGYIVARGRALWRNDLSSELRFRETLPRAGMRSDMTIPLRSRGQVTGALRIACRRRHAYEPEEFEVLGRLADVMAMAVENQRLLQVTRRMAEIDGLTGVCNRRHFQVLLGRETERARSSGHPLALLMADVDHFKQVNDRFGHPTGDAVLQHVARVLARRLRRSDVVARHGGEEFAILLPGTDATAAAGLAEELRREIERSPAAPAAGSDPLPVSVSFGVAALPRDADGEAELVAAADRALYRAKQSGRNRVESAAAS